MTFTPTPHPPYQWHDTPAIDTPLNEAHLEAAETDIIAYVQGQLIALDALVEGLMETPANKDVANGYAGLDAGAKLKTSELPSSVVTASSPLGDLYGRTKVIGTSSVQAPSLPSIASVMDDPWSGKNDAVRVTDGAMTAGSNVLNSPSSTFTTAVNAGQRVLVLGAGPAGVGANTLFAYIGSVTDATHVNLVTTQGGSTPANATNTVGPVTVTYGTEATAAFNAAQTAVSTGGGGTLLVPAIGAFLIGKVTPVSNVTLMAYGATIYLTNDVNCGFQAQGADAAVVNWSIRGAHMPDDNVVYGSGTRAAIWCTIIGSSDLGVYDCTISNNRDTAIVFDDVPRCTVRGNTISNCCPLGGRNPINIGTAVGSAIDCTIDGNILIDNHALGIHLGTRGGATLTIWEFRATITNNRISSPTISGQAITLEVGESGPGGGGREVVISGNIGKLPVAGSNGIVLTTGAQEGLNQEVTVTGNLMDVDAAPLVLNASEVTVTGNYLKSTNVSSSAAGIGTLLAQTTITSAVLDGTTNVLTSVTYNAANQFIANGTGVSGTGITAGSYLVSGAGTSTWVISQNTTSAGTFGVTGLICNTNVNIVGNTIHMAAPTSFATTTAGINLANVAESNCSNNLVFFDAGGAGTSMYGIFFQNSFSTTLSNNRIKNAPRWGLRLANVHDCDITLNKVYNCNQNNTAAQACDINSCWNLDIDFNTFKDDRSGSKMTMGISVAGTNGGLRARGNRISGFSNTTGAINGGIVTGVGFTEIAGNIADLITTQIAVGSNGAVLPQGTINVVSTAGFPSSGNVSIGADTVAYTGVTATTFTGCTGGTQTLATGVVVSQPRVPNPTQRKAETYPGSTVSLANTDPYDKYLIISGGTISVISFQQPGTNNFDVTGLTQGIFPWKRGASIKVTSTVNPTTFESTPA